MRVLDTSEVCSECPPPPPPPPPPLLVDDLGPIEARLAAPPPPPGGGPDGSSSDLWGTDNFEGARDISTPACIFAFAFRTKSRDLARIWPDISSLVKHF